MNKSRSYSLMALVAIPIIIYFYFLRWRTNAIYGDDINIYMGHFGLHSFGEKVNMDLVFGKFRPVHGLVINFLVEVFKKHLKYYYLFNVGIQTVNTFLLAAILNLFLKSPGLSFFFGLILGLSRFSFFNITQLYNGGALEGLAMGLFLVSLFFILNVLTKSELVSSKKLRGIALSILFANLSMYTHERYIVIFPFIILTVLIFPGLKTLTLKQKAALVVAASLSIILNIVIKEYVYSIPFLAGTAGTQIRFSLSSATSFLEDALLSVFQFNSGPDYLAGISYSSLPIFNKLLVIVVFSGILSIVIVYIFRVRKAYVSRDKGFYPGFFILLLLAGLFILFLIPAVVTIRLEQRWLQASFGIFVLMIAIMFNQLPFRNKHARNYLFCAFVILFLWTDYNYLDRGANNLYMVFSEKVAAEFEQAIANGVIRPNTKNVYIWEKQRDSNGESAINWDLGGGLFFRFYQNTDKKIIFVDDSSRINFKKDSDQMIYSGTRVIDITKQYLQDSLKTFTNIKLDELAGNGGIQYDQRRLLIDNETFDKFSMDGFYENENGIRWTNGKADIGLMGDYTVKDSVKLILSTYMPPVCKAIRPKIFLTEENNVEHQPVFSAREADKFTFTFYFKQLTTIKRINILSDTINAYPDRRVLSFPFVSIEIENGLFHAL
jgi:hypothetical protein